MFTMPAIHHSYAPMEDGCMGTLALNALNGSSSALGQDTSGSDQNIFGGLFSSSLTENHPYRPQDRGMSFHQGESQRSSTSSSKMVKRANSFMKSSEPRYQLGPRRRSLDLDRLTIPHSREDRAHSIGEIMFGREARFAELMDDSIDEGEISHQVDLAGLRLSELCINTSRRDSADSSSKSSHSRSSSKSKKSNKHTDKTKETNHRDHSKHGRPRKDDESMEECRGQMTSSKHEKSRHTKSQSRSDSAHRK